MFPTLLPYVFVMSCGLLAGAEPFRLKIAGLSDAWFPGGAVIRVPPEKSAEIQVLLAKPWSEEITAERLSLRMDEVYAKFIRSSSGEGTLLSIFTREARGLLTRANHIVDASAAGAQPLEAQWTILRWDRSYVESTFVNPGGVPLSIRIQQPPGGVIVGGGANIRVAGEVLGNPNARVTIAGQTVTPVAGLPGFHFDRRIALPAGAKELILTAADGDGDSTIVALKVLRSGN